MSNNVLEWAMKLVLFVVLLASAGLLGMVVYGAIVALKDGIKELIEMEEE